MPGSRPGRLGALVALALAVGLLAGCSGGGGGYLQPNYFHDEDRTPNILSGAPDATAIISSPNSTTIYRPGL